MVGILVEEDDSNINLVSVQSVCLLESYHNHLSIYSVYSIYIQRLASPTHLIFIPYHLDLGDNCPY